MEQATAQSNGNRMSPIIGLKLLHDIFDVKVYGGLGNRELIGNLLVTVSIADQFENLQFTRSEIFLTQVLCYATRNLRRDPPSPGSDLADDLQQLILGSALKHIRRRSCPQSSLNLYITARSRQHDDPGLRELIAYRYECFGPTRPRQSLIHQD